VSLVAALLALPLGAHQALAQAPPGAPGEDDVVAPVAPAEAPAPAGSIERWAGRFVVTGERRVPVLGHVSYRSETRTLSEVTRHADGSLTLRQRTCDVVFAKTAGATLEMNPKGPAGMPVSTISFPPRPSDGSPWASAPWPSGWDEQDLDGDGQPGITIKVSAPLCGGQLMVASDARSTASALEPTPEGALRGDVAIWTLQHVLDARGICLSLFSRSSEETMLGRFRYAPVTATTCDGVSWSGVPDVE
jgi:hypothetical protein